MANQEHLEILKQGAVAWNKWRREHLTLHPDLSHTNFSDANLTGAQLYGADLSHTKLSNANLSNTNLNNANLSVANLTGANLTDANLSGAHLSHANLNHANLNNATLTAASFYRAGISETSFAGIDLREVKGLETVDHHGPSQISVKTIYLSEGKIPEIFLRGCGLMDWEIENTKLYRTDLSRNEIIDLTYNIIGLRSDPLIQFNSCFISYSSKDEEFATRLYSDLQQSGVRCWFAPEHMKIGDRIRRRIDDSIRLHDKLLLILSETSVVSQWIEQEVATALEKEREQGCDVLFPVRLDDAVKNVRSDWPALIRNTRHIGDFRRWNDYEEYKRSFIRLLDDLRVETKWKL
jgi:uncharacterized protein YjbI with pentapeptide repeats